MALTIEEIVRELARALRATQAELRAALAAVKKEDTMSYTIAIAGHTEDETAAIDAAKEAAKLVPGLYSATFSGASGSVDLLAREAVSTVGAADRDQEPDADEPPAATPQPEPEAPAEEAAETPAEEQAEVPTDAAGNPTR